MKRFLTIVFFSVLFTSFSNAQTVNGTPLSEINVEYIQIVGKKKFLSNKVDIKMDFGQSTKLIGSSKQTQLKDKNGKRLKFNSMIDALNFMSSNGYKFVDYNIAAVGSQLYYSYLLKKAK